MTEFPNPSVRNPLKAILPLGALYALVNLFAFRLVPLLSEGSEWYEWRLTFWRNVAVAFIASEVAALSMVLVFAPGRFIRRLAYCWAAAGALCACWLIGADIIRVAFKDGLTGNVWSIPLSLPMTALIVQTPLWALRLCFGWRWERQPDAQATVEVRWSLADLFIGTALVALALGLARVAALSGDLHMAWVSFGEHTCVLSLFGVAPAMLLLLRSRSWWFGAPLFLIYAALGGCLYLTIQYGLNPDDAKHFWLDAEFIISVIVPPFVSFAVGLALATGVARANGFRLVMGHPRPSGKAPADQPPCAVSTAKDL